MRGPGEQLTSRQHGVFFSQASGLYFVDTSTYGSFYQAAGSGDRARVPSIIKDASPFEAGGAGPFKKGDVIFFGSNGDIRLASGLDALYDGCGYEVVQEAGYTGSDTRTNKRKREVDKSSNSGAGSCGGGGGSGGSSSSSSSSSDGGSGGSNRLSIDAKLQGKTAEEVARILHGAARKAAKQARKEAQAEGAESPGRFGGHHASAAAATRAYAASTGSSARRSKAEQARFEKAQRSLSRIAGKRPGNQKAQSAHKKKTHRRPQEAHGSARAPQQRHAQRLLC